LAAKIGFFFVLFHKQTIGSRKQFPVEVFGRFSGIVQTVLSKFDRKTVKRTSVQSGNKTFNHLFRDEFEVIELLQLLDVEEIVHSCQK
jgi:hypothetical protein